MQLVSAPEFLESEDRLRQLIDFLNEIQEAELS